MARVIFVQRSTGFPLLRVDNRQPNPELTAHLLEVSAEYGIGVNDLERVESSVDVRLDPNVIAPVPVPDTRTPAQVVIDNIRGRSVDPDVALGNPQLLRQVIGELIQR